MAFDWTQGSAPPPVNITQAQSTTAPGFYTDYLKTLGSTGEAMLGAEAPKYVGEQELQTTAFDEAKNRMFGSQGYLDAASRFGQGAAASTAEQLSGYKYTDPVTGVVSNIGGGYSPADMPDYFGSASRFGNLSGATTAQQLEGYEVTDPATGKKVKIGGGYGVPNTQDYFDTSSRLGALSNATIAQQLQGYQYKDPATGKMVDAGGGYMNPFVSDVVSEINRLGQRQMREALPGSGGLGVGTGGFGGKRGLQQESTAKREALRDILGAQSTALQSGYDAASKLAASDLARYLQGAGTFGQLGQAGYETSSKLAANDLARYLQGAGTFGQLGQAGYDTASRLAQGDLNRYLQGAQAMGGLGQIASGTNIAELQNLASLGAQQQAIAQGEENFPLQTAQAVSGLLRGYTMPTDTSSTYEGPLAGLQYSPSGLQQMSTLAGLFAPTGTAGTGASAIEGIIKAGSSAIDVLGKLFGGNNG